MFNIFQQPWTLIGASVIVLFIVFTIRSVWPEKRHRWQWAIPLGVVLLAIGLDAIVRTDMEKVEALMGRVMEAAQSENCQAIGQLVADDYSDSYHPGKAELMANCQARLSESLIRKIKVTSHLIELTPPTALVSIFGVVHFEEDSYIARDYRPFVFFKVQFYMEKQAGGKWRITRIEIREIDKQPFSWGAWR
mgnify:CR=1 FL=1